MPDLEVALVEFGFVYILVVMVLCHREYRDNTKSEDFEGKEKRKPLSHRYKNYEHISDDEQRVAEQFSWRNSFLLNALIAAAAGITLIFAAGTYYETQRQANIANSNLIYANRPYVNVESIGFEKSTASGPDGANLFIAMKNSGITSSRKLIFKSLCSAYEPSMIASNWSKMLLSKPNGVMPLGAQDSERVEEEGSSCYFSNGTLQDFIVKNKSILILGLITYHDSLEPKVIHRTEFCYIQSVHLADPKQSGFGGPIDVCDMNMHNCVDDECDNLK